MRLWARFVRFNIVGAIGVGVQLAALWILADVAHVHYMFATPAAVGLAVANNFAWHWRWTWRDRAEAGGVAGAFVRFVLANGVVSLVGNFAVTSAFVAGARLDPVVANAVAIGVCGLLNFRLGHEVVFRERPASTKLNRQAQPLNRKGSTRMSIPEPTGRARRLIARVCSD